MPLIDRLNKDKCFLLQAERYKQIDLDRYNLGEDWFQKLTDLCTTDPDVKLAFELKAGESSTYTLKPTLLANLKLHYLILSDALKTDYPELSLSTDKKQVMIDKLLEGVSQCTPGFHDRVNSNLMHLFAPQTIDQILGGFRAEIVEREARQVTDDVHGHNTVFKTAFSMDLGVNPVNDQDVYSGRADDPVTVDKLQRAFSERYQPFGMLLVLQQTVSSRFSYSGKKEGKPGYVMGEYGPGLSLLNGLFNTPDNTDCLLMDDNGLVYDFDWGLILSRLWSQLNADGFVRYTPEERDTIQDYLVQPNTDKDVSIVNYLTTESELAAYLALESNASLSDENRLAIIFNFIDLHMADKPGLSDEIWKIVAKNKGLTADSIHQVIQKYPESKNKLFLGVINANTTVSLMKEILEKFPSENLGLALTATNAEGYNAVMLAARDCPKALPALLSKLDGGALLQALQQTVRGNYNAFALAANMDPPVPLHIHVEDFMLDLMSRMEEESAMARNIFGRPGVVAYYGFVLLVGGADAIALSPLILIACMGYVLWTKIVGGITPATIHPEPIPYLLKSMLTLCPEEQASILNQVSHQIRMGQRGDQGDAHLMCLLMGLSLDLRTLTDPSPALEAAKTLQKELVESLVVYWDGDRGAGSLSTLQAKWGSAIKQARATDLPSFVGWRDLIDNLAMAVVTLGGSVVYNLYQSGGKTGFFQPKTAIQLDKLEEGIERDLKPSSS